MLAKICACTQTQLAALHSFCSVLRYNRYMQGRSSNTPPHHLRAGVAREQFPRPALLWALWAALRAGAGVGMGTSWTGAYHGKPRELSPAIYGGEGAY